MSSLKHFSKKFPGGIVGIVALLLILAAIVVASFVSSRGQKVDNSAAAALTSLALTPSSQTLTPGQNFTLTTVMNTSTNKVIGIDMEVDYDPSAIEILTIQKGTSITNFDQQLPGRNTIDNTAGSVVFGVFTLDVTKAIQELRILHLIALQRLSMLLTRAMFYRQLQVQLSLFHQRQRQVHQVQQIQALQAQLQGQQVRMLKQQRLSQLQLQKHQLQ